MTYGFTLESEQVEKVIKYYQDCGRKVDSFSVRYMATTFNGQFDSATECVESFKSLIWNMRLVW